MPHRALALTLFAATALVVPSAGRSSKPPSPDEAASTVATKLQSVRAVEFYFLSRTEEWNYTPDEVAAESTIRAYRACGGNCSNFMDPVIDHLRQARPIKCIPGGEDGLIRANPGVELVYSSSGRRVRVADHCYFND